MIQAPQNLQSWNAYTYVFNNPLTYTDPTGMFVGGLIGAIFGSPSLSSVFLQNITKHAIRSGMRAIGPNATSAAISVGCSFAGPWAPLCYAGANYDATRAFGGSSKDALSAGAVSGLSSWAFGSGGRPANFTQGAVTAGLNFLAAQNPELGRALMFVYGNWGNDVGAWLQNAVGETFNYYASKEVQRLAVRLGLTLQELNLLLIGNSYLGKALAGTSYTPDYLNDTATVGGFFSRAKHSLLGGIWDANDVLLNIQGLPDAVSMGIIRDKNRPQNFSGHSLGAWRVNNLHRMGYIKNATLLSLPGLSYPSSGSNGVCAANDPICGGGIMSWLRPGTSSVPGNGLFSHKVCAIAGYRTLWSGEGCR